MRPTPISRPRPDFRTAMSAAGFQKTTFWHDIKRSDTSTLIEDESGAADGLISISPNREEMLCCHVTVFTVCWQKCHSERSISVSCQSRQEISGLISDNRECVMCSGGFPQDDLCLSCGQIHSRCCDKSGVNGLEYHCHDRVQVSVQSCQDASRERCLSLYPQDLLIFWVFLTVNTTWSTNRGVIPVTSRFCYSGLFFYPLDLHRRLYSKHINETDACIGQHVVYYDIWKNYIHFEQL